MISLFKFVHFFHHLIHFYLNVICTSDTKTDANMWFDKGVERKQNKKNLLTKNQSELRILLNQKRGITHNDPNVYAIIGSIHSQTALSVLPVNITIEIGIIKNELKRKIASRHS